MNVFIFYRDLRLHDNTTLIELCSKGNKVFPIFILERKEWPSKNQYQFLIETLIHLNNMLMKRYHTKLYIFTKSQLNTFLRSHIKDIEYIGWNKTVMERAIFKSLQRKFKDKVIEKEDAFLCPPEDLHHPVFRKFTPFYRFCLEHCKVKKINPFTKFKFTTHIKINTPQLSLQTLYTNIKNKNTHFYTQGGYKNALKQLHIGQKTLKHYGQTRNTFHIPTSMLSSYLSLNVLSIRQVYFSMNRVSKDFIRELYWRDFYMHVTRSLPKVINYGFNVPQLSEKKKKEWSKWKKGQTGKPIVDACMTQLNTTGYMHNRGRMIVASYLIKNMNIHFKYGEKYFENTLIDHNLSSNNGGWQWVNGSGVDSQPKYQKFNMLIQNKKYDPDCVFIKEWLPYLQNMSTQEIFNMYN